MTEQEWLECADPQRMLEFLRGKASDRKLRLFAVACCRRVLSLAPLKRNREELEVAERFADSTATDGDLKKTFDATFDARLVGTPHIPTSWALLPTAFDAAIGATEYVAHFISMRQRPGRRLEARRQESTIHSRIGRDIVGNPFRPMTIDTAWLTSTAVSLAQGIYEDRAFDRLPILADALEDAGCMNEEILKHCREPGEHARGCWAVDLLLAKR